MGLEGRVLIIELEGRDLVMRLVGIYITNTIKHRTHHKTYSFESKLL